MYKYPETVPMHRNFNRKDMSDMTDEDIAMIEWLQNATNEEILREMHAVEREIFRRDE